MNEETGYSRKLELNGFHRDRVTSLCFSGEGAALFVGSAGGAVGVVGMEGRGGATSLGQIHNRAVLDMEYFSGSQMLVSSGEMNEITQWAASNGKVVRRFGGHQAVNLSASQLRFRRRGKRMFRLRVFGLHCAILGHEKVFGGGSGRLFPVGGSEGGAEGQSSFLPRFRWVSRRARLAGPENRQPRLRRARKRLLFFGRSRESAFRVGRRPTFPLQPSQKNSPELLQTAPGLHSRSLPLRLRRFRLFAALH